MQFKLKSSFKPAGDQPTAINQLTQSIKQNNKHQVLLGVTGSGKTFALANIIQNIQRPTLVISHNKTLAAQTYQEFKQFFPNNAVSYFVSYYDYYQPEAYIPQTDTYIEKEVDINDEIERLRLQATTHLFTRKDVIVVASVSAIYNLGAPEEWSDLMLTIKKGQNINRDDLLKQILKLQYERSDYDFKRGTFRLKGETLQIWPAYEESSVNIRLLENKVESITPTDPLTGKKPKTLPLNWAPGSITLYPAKHYLTNPDIYSDAVKAIRQELKSQVKFLKSKNKLLEAHRLTQKINFDLEMINETGYTSGIENYSRHFDGRSPGQPPFSLLDYFKNNSKDFLTIIDESHMTVPQIRGMYRGDQARKSTLIDFGFRLPSALDNRPLKFNEFINRTPQLIYTSATPSDWELNKSRSTTEIIVRPTGLLDPPVDIRPTKNQIDDLLSEIKKRIKIKQRVLVTTLTKRMSEALSEHLKQLNIKVHYLHSDIVTLDRTDILDDLRKGKYDVVVGINLLREGLDLPEVSLVAILDADKEGFLRSQTSLIQTMGRAARHQDGYVIMYADKITRSMKAAIKEVKRRRKKQVAHNKKHNIKPRSIKKSIRPKLIKREPKPEKQAIIPEPDSLTPQDKVKLKKDLKKQMLQAAKELNFELAAQLRDTIEQIKT